MNKELKNKLGETLIKKEIKIRLDDIPQSGNWTKSDKNRPGGLEDWPIEDLIEEIHAARKQGQEEAWTLSQNIVKNGGKGGIPYSELKGIFGDDCIYQAIVNHSYAEAAEKVRTWEEKESKEVKVGDLVRTIHGSIALVTKTISKSACLIFCDGSEGIFPYEIFTKIGRLFAIEDLLKEIGAEE